MRRPIDVIFTIISINDFDINSNELKRICDEEMDFARSRTSFQTSDFHEHCDNHANPFALIVITKNLIFRRFASLDWDSSGNWTVNNFWNTFLFTVNNIRE
jgi:hypothetical protein